MSYEVVSIEASLKLQEEVTKLNPSPIVELYSLDLTPTGDSTVLSFHNGSNGIRERVLFKGIAYDPLPIFIRGFETNANGDPARPTLSIMNLGGFMSAAALSTNDLVGAIVTRRRTFAKYLDGKEEAAGGNQPEYPQDIFVIEQKLRENRQVLEFELGSGFDLDGVRFPNRQVIGSYCTHFYRLEGCSFGGRVCIADKNNVVFPGGGQYVGIYDTNATYKSFDCVEFEHDDFWRVYEATDFVPVGGITGAANAPDKQPAYWHEKQRWRGLWLITDSYLKNDVVSIEYKDGRYTSFGLGVGAKFIAMAKMSLPSGSPAPPNSKYWELDFCSKSIGGCRKRFDGRLSGSALPFGGFPGTTQMPQGL